MAGKSEAAGGRQAGKGFKPASTERLGMRMPGQEWWEQKEVGCSSPPHCQVVVARLKMVVDLKAQLHLHADKQTCDAHPAPLRFTAALSGSGRGAYLSSQFRTGRTAFAMKRSNGSGHSE